MSQGSTSSPRPKKRHTVYKNSTSGAPAARTALGVVENEIGAVLVTADCCYSLRRISSPEQPEVEEILKHGHIEEDDAVSLLKHFGERTIANPFRLKAA